MQRINTDLMKTLKLEDEKSPYKYEKVVLCEDQEKGREEGKGSLVLVRNKKTLYRVDNEDGEKTLIPLRKLLKDIPEE